MTRLIPRPEPPPPPEDATPSTVRVSGVVTFHEATKAFGKIHADGIEYFFHITSCPLTFAQMTEGTPVTFTWALTNKGPRAFDVHRNLAPLPEEVDAAETRGNR